MRADWLARFRGADVSLFFDFAPPPYGGGNQFLLALWKAFERRGLRVENNTISRTTRACLYNSFNFDHERLRRLRRVGCRMVHRVDGPIGTYRGEDSGIDRQICQINHELADATIFQSEYSLRKHCELGFQFKNATVIRNAVNPAIFHARGRAPFDRARKVRLIATSWSDNPNKGADTYAWLEERLDWARFDFTFVGRSPIRFSRIRMVPPVPSERLADLLREHHVFISASRHESCSNALLEALSCGLPAVYHDSGGSRELAGETGFGFSDRADIPTLLGRLVDEYEAHRDRISVPSVDDVAARYLAVMGL